MTYIPKPDGTAKKLAFLFILTGFVLMLFSSVLPYAAVFQAISFALIIAGVFLLQRYVLCEFRYIVDDRDDGSADLLVYRKQGKNDVKVCHVSLLNVTDIYKFGEKKDTKAARYAYNRNMSDDKYVICVLDDERTTEIVLEVNDAFLTFIRERAGGGGGDKSFAM